MSHAVARRIAVAAIAVAAPIAAAASASANPLSVNGGAPTEGLPNVDETLSSVSGLGVKTPTHRILDEATGEMDAALPQELALTDSISPAIDQTRTLIPTESLSQGPGLYGAVTSFEGFASQFAPSEFTPRAPQPQLVPGVGMVPQTGPILPQAGRMIAQPERVLPTTGANPLNELAALPGSALNADTMSQAARPVLGPVGQTVGEGVNPGRLLPQQGGHALPMLGMPALSNMGQNVAKPETSDVKKAPAKHAKSESSTVKNAPKTKATAAKKTAAKHAKR